MCPEEDVGKMQGMVIIAEEQTGGIGRMGGPGSHPAGDLDHRCPQTPYTD